MRQPRQNRSVCIGEQFDGSFTLSAFYRGNAVPNNSLLGLRNSARDGRRDSGWSKCSEYRRHEYHSGWSKCGDAQRHEALRKSTIAFIDNCHEPAQGDRLGRRTSRRDIQPGHTLVTTGVYGVIRHPGYLGLLVNSLGWGLTFRSGVGVLLTALLIPPLHAPIKAEEKLLRSEFGDAYDAYRARTGRMVPGIY